MKHLYAQNLKFLYSLSLVIVFIFSSNCTHIIQKDFDATKKIQVIPVTKHDYIYAQNDHLINSTLEKELAKMSPDWNKEINKYNRNMAVATTGLTVQLVTLIACFASPGSQAALAWCGASIASGLLVAIPFSNKAKRNKHKYITDYNSKF